MAKKIALLLFIAAFLTPLASRAESVFRLEGGAFNGRIARSQSGNTVPFNAPNGSYFGGEAQWGRGMLRGLIGATYYSYTGKISTATGTETTELNFGDYKLGGVLASKCCELRLIFSNRKTPYTDSPSVNTLVPRTAQMNYVRGEALLNAKASTFRLQFQYYLDYPLASGEMPDGGAINSNYSLGGCAKILFGEKFRWGPGICIDIQELYLPMSVVIFHQEVHGRLAIEF